MASRSRVLRSGYTTGTCAAGAAKAAATVLVHALADAGEPGEAALSRFRIREVDVPLPDGKRVSLKVRDSGFGKDGPRPVAWASVIKDSGDDPDVTNGAEIAAEVSFERMTGGEEARAALGEECALSGLRVSDLSIKGGRGVGLVTKPGLPVPVGEAAINPVPRRMIEEAVREAITELRAERKAQRTGDSVPLAPCTLRVEITISVPRGEELSKKTLNPRLGITGGISILGTSGIVKPLSSEAWTASITASMDVARAVHLDEIVLSAGRTSEKAHMKRYRLPEEAYVMMGDYIEFSLLDARRHGFRRIHLCAQWAKMLKIAMATPQTHVRHGAIEVRKSVELLNGLGIPVPPEREFNTARELFDYLVSRYGPEAAAFRKVCGEAKEYAGRIAGGLPVISHLVSYSGEIIAVDG